MKINFLILGATCLLLTACNDQKTNSSQPVVKQSYQQQIPPQIIVNVGMPAPAADLQKKVTKTIVKKKTKAQKHVKAKKHFVQAKRQPSVIYVQQVYVPKYSKKKSYKKHKTHTHKAYKHKRKHHTKPILFALKKKKKGKNGKNGNATPLITVTL